MNRRTAFGFAPPRWLLTLTISVGVLVGVLAIVQPTGSLLATSPLGAAQSVPPQTSYLYRFDPASQTFFTHTLPLGSRPLDVAVTGTAPVHIWATLAGTNKIGHLIYTNTSQMAWTEIAITSTANSQPYRLLLRGDEIWFTERGAGRVGRLHRLTGALDEFYDNGLSPDSGLADIDAASDGSIWLAGQTSNRLARLVVTSTTNYSFQEYSLGSTRGPFGIAVESDNRIHFTAPMSDRVGFLTPSTGAVVIANGVQTRPLEIVWHSSSNSTWFTEPQGDSIGQFQFGTTGIPLQYGPIARPVGLSRASGNTLWATQQDHVGRLAKLEYSFPANVTMTSYSLPTTGLYPTGVAIANDGGVWFAAYAPERLSLPVVTRHYGPSGPFGLQFYGSIGATTGFTYAVAARAGWIRFQVKWSTIEPVNTTPGNYNWTSLDTTVQNAVAAGINLILTFEFNPSWAAAELNGPVYNLSDLTEFVGAVVARYPNVTYWEMYNEPDSILAFGNNAAAYAAMMNAVYPVIKAANPSAQVVMGGLAMDWCEELSGAFDCQFLQDLSTHCAQPCFDVANFHYYPVYRKNWEPYGRDIVGKANRMRQLLAAYGFSRPVINTEAGWPSEDQWGSPELQARYVPKVYARGMAALLPVVNWFSMQDADGSKPGLLSGTHPNLVARKAYTALHRLTSILGGGQYVRTLSLTEKGSPLLEGYVFSVPRAASLKRVDVVWYDCPGLIVNTTSNPNLPIDCGNRAPFSVPAARVGIMNHLDGPLTILNDGDDSVIDGRVTIPGGVGTDPIYIDFNP